MCHLNKTNFGRKTVNKHASIKTCHREQNWTQFCLKYLKAQNSDNSTKVSQQFK